MEDPSIDGTRTAEGLSHLYEARSPGRSRDDDDRR